MKKSTPISLFSFQDIITCLTGIMIVVVLVILLQLVESTVAMMERAQLQPEYEVLLKKEKELQEEKQRLLQLESHGDETVKKYSDYSLEELIKLLDEEKKYALILKTELSRQLRELEQWKNKTSVLSKSIENARKQLDSLTRTEQQIAELFAQQVSLERKQVKSLQNAVAHKRKLLRIEFPGIENKKPLLISCYSWGFRCKEFPNGSVYTIGNPSKYTGKTAMLKSLVKWLNNYDMKHCYPVLLFTKDSLAMFQSITEKVYEIDKDIQLGKELILDSEEVF